MWDIVVLAAALIAGGQQPGVRQGQAATGTASIGGVVAKADTGAPIARATLRLTSPGGNRRMVMAPGRSRPRTQSRGSRMSAPSQRSFVRLRV